jgi:F-type H+-transporting ATPase subunit delta
MALRGSVARRYAKALFEIGVSEDAFERFEIEVGGLAALYASSKDLRVSMESPVVKSAEKQAVLRAILPRVAPSPSVQRFAMLLLERGRIPLLPAIAGAYRRLADQRAGQVRATVSTATPIGAADLDRVRVALEKRTRRKVIIETTVDPSLIGGIVARVGDLVLDGSVRAHLDEMRQRLLN